MATSVVSTMAEVRLGMRPARVAIGSSILVQLAGGGLAYVSQLVLARWLSAAAFGSYSVQIATVTIVALVSTAGSSGAALRFIPAALRDGDRHEVDQQVGSTLGTCVAGGVAVGALTIIAALIVGAGDAPATAMGCLVLLTALVTFGSDVGRAVGRNITTYGSSVVVRPLVAILAVGGLAAAGHSGTETTGLWIACGASSTAVTIQLMAIRPRVTSWSALRPRVPSPDLLRRSAPFLLGAGLSLLLSQIDLLAVAAVLPERETGVYAAAARLAAGMTLVPVAVNAVLTPRVAASADGRGTRVLRLAVRQAARWAAVGSFAVGLPLVLLPGQVLGLFGDGFSTGRWALVAIVLGQLASAACGPSGVVLMYTGRERLALTASALVVIASALACVLGAVVGGLDGAGLASGLMLAANGMAGAYLCWRFARIRTLA
jgi:O-antigen/teichoic acid export membrane protein